MLPSTVEVEELAEIVERHSVCFDVWPLQEVHEGELRQVGFEIDLVGAVDHAPHALMPGCPECEAVYRRLRRLALQAIPDAPSGLRIEILEFDAAFHESKQRGFREDIELKIQLMHRLEHELPVDPPERAYLYEITASLRALGVREGRR